MKFMSKKDKTGIARVSRCKNILRHKAWVKLGVFVLVGMGMQTAQAACPAIDRLSDLDRVSTGLPIVYFCKQQGFNVNQLTFAPSEAQLLSGSSRSISQGDTSVIQNFPVSNSVDLAGFTVNQLNLNRLSANFPNSGGYGNVQKQSIFNFFRAIRRNGNCDSYAGDNQYTVIKDFLRTNPSIFQANDGAQVGTTLNTNNNDLAVIEDVPIGHDLQTGQPLTADITFYHSNAGLTGQYFTRGLRYCWVGVSSRMDIKTDSNPPKYSGGYTVKVGVLTQ